MRRIFLDSNILLAFHFQDAEPRQQKAIEIIFFWIQNGRFHGQISIISFYQLLHFIDRSLRSPREASRRAYSYLKTLQITPFNPSSIEDFDYKKWEDYEDGLQYICALDGEADVIVTTNGYDFHSSQKPVIDPLNFVLRNMQAYEE